MDIKTEIQYVSSDPEETNKGKATVKIVDGENFVTMSVDIIKGRFGHYIKLPMTITLSLAVRKKVNNNVLQEYAKYLATLHLRNNTK